MRQRIAWVVAVAAVAAAACTGTKDPTKGEPAAGSAGSAAGSNGSAAGSGGSAAGSNGSAAGSGGSAAGSNGSAAGSGGSAAGSGGGADPEAARRACVPDCFWNLVSPCRPDGECTFQDTGAGWVECAEGGAWTRTFDPTAYWRTVVKKNGEVCYQVKRFDENRLDFYDKDNQIHAMVQMSAPGSNYIACDDTGGQWEQFKLNDPGCEEYRQQECSAGTCE